MEIFATGITFALLFLAVGLLFLPSPKKGKKDWPVRLAMAALIAALLSGQWLWQYSKFVDDHGLFYYISPTHGAIVLTTIQLILFVVAVAAIWRDWDDEDSAP